MRVRRGYERQEVIRRERRGYKGVTLDNRKASLLEKLARVLNSVERRFVTMNNKEESVRLDRRFPPSRIR